MLNSNLPFEFIDLFAGIGGFRCALTSLGGKCVFTSEWDKFCVTTYKSWFDEKQIYTDDIRRIDPASEIPDHHILCAGFPCQPFSVAGVSKKRSLGRSHGFKDRNQGNLFFKIVEIVRQKQPPVLLLENVKNLKSHDGGNTWKTIHFHLRKEGYAVFSKIIDARYCVPQHRERIFIVCFRKDTFGNENQINFNFPESHDLNHPKLNSILTSSPPDKKYMLSNKLWKYLQDYADKHKQKGNGFGYGLNKKNDVARTLSARYHKDGAEILIHQNRWKNPRRLTPEEAKYLMGFTDDYARLFGHENGFPQIVSDTQAYRQFGNAVIPRVVEDITKNIQTVLREHF